MQFTNRLIRPDILALDSYHVPDASGLIKLDAMENPYTLPPELRNQLASKLASVALNRYPVPSYSALKNTIREHLSVPESAGLVLGNGSDELIAMLSIACAKPGAKVLAPLPGFVMYAMSAQLAGQEFIGVPLRADFTLNQPAMLAAITEHRPAITYLAYPNNPTGNLFDEQQMLEIISACSEFGVVVVDEAYQPFAQTSFMPRLAQFDNLVVMRTVSKLGLAGIRLGYMAGAVALMEQFDKVRPPYNVNVLTEAAAQFALEHSVVLDQQAALIRAARAELSNALTQLPGVEVFPSSANFLLVRLQRQAADVTFAALLQRKVLVKNVSKMHRLLDNCLRVTVSTPQENALFLAALKEALAI